MGQHLNGFLAKIGMLSNSRSRNNGKRSGHKKRIEVCRKLPVKRGLFSVERNAEGCIYPQNSKTQPLKNGKQFCISKWTATFAHNYLFKFF